MREDIILIGVSFCSAIRGFDISQVLEVRLPMDIQPQNANAAIALCELNN